VSGRYKLRFDLQASGLAAGTTPSTARSLYTTSHATTSFAYLRTWTAMLAMLSLTTTGWCSPLMTATTTRGSIATTTTTAQWTTAVDSGTKDAAIVMSTLSVDVEMALDGTRKSMEVCCCRHLACGSRARSLHCATNFDAQLLWRCCLKKRDVFLFAKITAALTIYNIWMRFCEESERTCKQSHQFVTYTDAFIWDVSLCVNYSATKFMQCFIARWQRATRIRQFCLSVARWYCVKLKFTLDGCIVWNAHNTVLGSKRLASCATV